MKTLQYKYTGVMQIQADSNTHVTPLFRYESIYKLLTSVLRHEERDTILKSPSYHTMVRTPPTFGTYRGVLDPNSSSLVETRKT